MSLESLFAFQNHDINKLNITSDWFGAVLILLLFFLIVYPTKKKENPAFLSFEFTNELKGIAIVLIVVHHLARHTLADPRQLWVFYDMGYIGVALFLFLSGWGLAKSALKKGLDNFFPKKFLHIYIPFILVSLLWLFLDHTLSGVKYDLSSIIELFNGITFDRNYWYIQYLFFWYIAFFLIFSLNLDRKSKSILFILISFLCLAFLNFGNSSLNLFSFPLGVIAALYEREISFYFSHLNKNKKIFRQLLFIGAINSYLLYKITPHLQQNTRYLLFYLLVVIFFSKKSKFLLKILPFLLIFYYVFYSTLISLSAKSLTMSFSALFAILAFILLIAILNKTRASIFYSLLGKISFELYLLHGAFMYSYDFILYKIPLEYSFPIYLALIIFISMALNKLFRFLFLAVDKLPILKVKSV